MWPCSVKEFLNADTIASIERLKQIPATIWLTATPITSPARFITGEPLEPGEIAAVICRRGA